MRLFCGMYVVLMFFLFITQAVSQDPFTIKDPNPGDRYTSNSVAWGDFNNDGYQDVFLGNGANISNQSFIFEDFLYRNNGDGTFTRMTGQPLTDDIILTGSGNWGDYDEDGDLDIYVAYTDDTKRNPQNKNMLYTNDGSGNFTKATAAGAPVDDNTFSNTSGFGDYDNNGTLDIFLKNGWQLSKEPQNLYSNDGDGTFTDIDAGDMTGSVGQAKISGFAACDFDMDNDLDIFVCSGNGVDDNRLWRNDGGNTYTSVGSFPHGFSNGASWGDIDNDGDFDLFVANYGGDNKLKNDLYLNNGDGTFTQNSTNALTLDESWSMGSAFGDIDNDGDLDLYVANDYEYDTNPNFLFINDGNGNFTKNTTSVAVTDEMSQAPHGVAFADYDNNGFLDLFAAVHGPNFFLENNEPNNGNTDNWILVNLTGENSTKTAIGAKVWATATIDGTQITQLREVSSQTGMGSNNSYRVHFGFGDATVISELKVEFLPVSLSKTSTTMTYTNVQTNQIINITEGEPIAVELASFYAKTQGNTVTLEWTTASEINHAGFFVQKRHGDEQRFQRIHGHMITGQGNAARGNQYSYQDKLSDAQQAYYRIENISNDGVSTFSNAISISTFSNTDDGMAQPAQFSLSQNYPNPFNPQTTIAYELAASTTVELNVYDVHGRLVCTLASGIQPAGSYSVQWNGKTNDGQRVGSGIYFYTLKAEGRSVTRKMILAY